MERKSVIQPKRRGAAKVAAGLLAALLFAVAQWSPAAAGIQYKTLTNAYCPTSEGATGVSSAYSGASASVSTYYLGSSSGCVYRMMDAYYWKISGSYQYQGQLQWVTYNIGFNDGGAQYPGAKAQHRICDVSGICGTAQTTQAEW